MGPSRFFERETRARHTTISEAGICARLGKELSGRIASLQDFARPFKDDNSNLANTITRQIVEDSETVFEMRVTEYFTEVVFTEANAVHLGHRVSVMAISGFRPASTPNSSSSVPRRLCKGMIAAIFGMCGIHKRDRSGDADFSNPALLRQRCWRP